MAVARHPRCRWRLPVTLMALLGGASCGPPAARPEPPHGPRHPPPKPGESITHTKMCSCKSCEPASCCHELEQDQPEPERCNDGYDFSRCGMSVSSCDSRCYQHRWRTHIDVGCEASRPDRCCSE